MEQHVYGTHISPYVKNVTAERELTITNTTQQKRFKEADVCSARQKIVCQLRTRNFAIVLTTVCPFTDLFQTSPQQTVTCHFPELFQTSPQQTVTCHVPEFFRPAHNRPSLVTFLNCFRPAHNRPSLVTFLNFSDQPTTDRHLSVS